MQFKDIIGHREIVHSLQQMIDSEKIPHAMLFIERAGYGALPLALATIKYLFCNNKDNANTQKDSCSECNSCKKIEKLAHPDLHFIFPINSSTLVAKDRKSDVEDFYPLWRSIVLESQYFSEQELYEKLGIENKLGVINVAQANGIINKLSLSSYEGKAKVVLVMFPERMNSEAANKLLKSLEEPLPDTYYFLITHNPDKMLVTVLSRCRRIEVPPIEKEDLKTAIIERHNIDDTYADFLANATRGSYGRVLSTLNKENVRDEKYELFLSILESSVSKDLLSLFDIWEKVAAWGKETQKAFCIDGMEILRKLYMNALELQDLSYSSKEEREKLNFLSGRIKKDFYEKGYLYLESAADAVERNVNPKFIFCDLCNRFYYTI